MARSTVKPARTKKPARTNRKAPTRRKKGVSTKKTIAKTYDSTQWVVRHGELKRGRGRPNKIGALFKVVAEKIPFDALDAVRKDVERRNLPRTGIYVAHDSMGVARYVGRGNIFRRLRARYRKQVLELLYFSFYVVEEKSHEREIETLLIRAAGPQLHFNDRKKRVDIETGSLRDYEPGTRFYERRYKHGRRASQGTRRRSTRR